MNILYPSFEGAHIIVTGASSPCALHLIKLLISSGAELTLVDKHISGELSQYSDYSSVSVAKLDLMHSQDFRKYNNMLLNSENKPTGLVNMAAITGTHMRDDKEGNWANMWDVVLDTNAMLPLKLIEHFSECCSRTASNLSVVNVSSIYSLLGPRWKIYEGTNYVSPAAYHASKAALNQITRWTATRLGHNGIRVNSVSPGGIYRNHQADFVSRYSNNVPLRRMASDNEIAEPIWFLLSPWSSYITGHNLVVDGGLSIQA